MAAMATLMVGSATRPCAGDIVIGLNMIKSGFMKTFGEATEASVDIAVDEINAKAASPAIRSS